MNVQRVVSRDVQEKAAALPVRAFALELTKGCNLRCGYCYYAQRDEAYDPSNRMSPEVARQSVDRLLSDGPVDQPAHLHFFGGEPLLEFGLLRDTVLYAEARAAAEGRAFTFEVTTNGTRFNAEVNAFLNDHGVHVGVSFDGPPEVQDAARPAASRSSYAMAEAGIREFLASRRGTALESTTHVSVVVTRRELDVSAIADHLEGLGFSKIILTFATDLEGAGFGVRPADLPDIYGRLEVLAAATEARLRDGRAVAATWFTRLLGRVASGERRTQPCSGGRDYLGVAADGSVSLCYRFFEMDEFGLGDVAGGIDRGVTERLLSTPLESREPCRSCWARHYCGGGCHHDNHMSTGDMADPNPVACDIFRYSMGRTLDMWGRLVRSGLAAAAPAAEPRRNEDMSERPTGFTSEDRPRRKSSCHVRDLEGERVVYEPTSHEVVLLNASAAFIFDLCDGSHPVSDMVESLTRRYAAPREALARDLEQTLEHFRNKQLLE